MNVLDMLMSMLQPPEGTFGPEDAETLAMPVAEPAHVPAGKVTPIVRAELTDATDPKFLANMVSSADLTEADIDRTVCEALQAQASQDDLIEDGGRLIGLRISEVRPAPTAPAAAPPAAPAAPAPPVTQPYI